MMDEIYSLVIENKNKDIRVLIEEISPYCIEIRKTESCTGMEIVSIIMSSLQLLIALIAIPTISEAINRKRIVVRVGGIKLDDTAEKILLSLKQSPELMSELKKVLKTGTLEIEGTAVHVAAFLKELHMIADENGDN